MVKTVSKYGLAAAVAVVIPIVFVSDAALAISLGRMQPDGMICRELFGTPHDHHGRGRGATKAEAMAKAVKRWTGFTAFEYGRRWSDYRIARRKGIACGPGHRGGWRCKVDGQPCKR